MNKFKTIIFKLLVLMLSLLFTDGGRSLSGISENVKLVLEHDNSTDFELPQHHHSVNISTDEKWVETLKIDLSCGKDPVMKFLFISNTPSGDFSDSIWQPPKLV